MADLGRFLWLMSFARKPQLALWAVLLLVVSLMDGISLALLIPLLSVVMDDAAASGLSATVFHVLAWLKLPTGLGGILGLYVLLIAVRSTAGFLRDAIALKTMLETVDRVRSDCVSQLFSVQWRWIRARRRSDHVNLLTVEANRIGGALTAWVGLFTGLGTIAAYGVLILYLSPGAGSLFLAFALIVFLLLRHIRRDAETLGRTQLGDVRRLMAVVQHGLTGLKLAKILGIERRQIADITSTINHLRQTQMRFGLQNSAVSGLQNAGSAAVLAVFVYLGVMVFEIELASLFVLILVFARLSPLFIGTNRYLHQIRNAAGSLDMIQEFLAETHRNADPERVETAAASPLGEGIVCRGVTLQFDGAETASLQDISLRIEAGTTTLIHGPSGAGKSTLADVLLGLLQPTSGTISVDGVELNAETTRRWRRSLGYVPQELYFFHDTVRANLCLAVPQATEDQIETALNMASAGFVFDLPEGLETVIGDDGHLLSGGQRQRLGLARCLLQSPEMLVLDEATSNLDPESEAQIADALRALSGKITMIIIGHNLEVFDFADQVIELRNGKMQPDQAD